MRQSPGHLPGLKKKTDLGSLAARRPPARLPARPPAGGVGWGNSWFARPLPPPLQTRTGGRAGASDGVPPTRAQNSLIFNKKLKQKRRFFGRGRGRGNRGREGPLPPPPHHRGDHWPPYLRKTGRQHLPQGLGSPDNHRKIIYKKYIQIIY
jgi:hypothetical protein